MGVSMFKISPVLFVFVKHRKFDFWYEMDTGINLQQGLNKAFYKENDYVTI